MDLLANQANPVAVQARWLADLGYLLALMVGLIIVAIFPWISIGFL